MATRSKAVPAKSVRQSVTIPATLAVEVRRVAKDLRLTTGRALVQPAERSVRADTEAEKKLKAAYRNFVEAEAPERKSGAGRDLLRELFGKATRAEDSTF